MGWSIDEIASCVGVSSTSLLTVIAAIVISCLLGQLFELGRVRPSAHVIFLVQLGSVSDQKVFKSAS